MKGVAFVAIGEVNSQPLVQKKILELGEGEVLFLVDEFDEGDLVEGVDVVDGAAEIAEEAEEGQLFADGCVEEGGRPVDIEDVGGEAVLEEVLHALEALEGSHLLEVDGRQAVALAVENVGLVVPHAEEVERGAALRILEVEIGVDPLHEYSEEVGRGEPHQKMLDPPFFVVLVFLVHPRL